MIIGDVSFMLFKCKRPNILFFHGFIALMLLFVLALPSHSLANSKYASLVIDADTGAILHQENAGKKRHPASLVKMMTLYMTFQALEQNKLRINKKLRVSTRASKQPPSRLGLRRGQYITVRDAIMSLIVKSANDSAVVLAEAIGGSEWQFVNMMNRMGNKLGMKNTTFRNASGLHDRKQKTTAYDMARLSVALRRDYPRYYHLFNKSQFSYKGRTYKSHNKITKNYRGADGLKTGYIRAAGYNLATSAKRNGRSIVGIVLGGRKAHTRDKHMVKLLDKSFRKVSGGVSRISLKHNNNVPKPIIKASLSGADNRSLGGYTPSGMGESFIKVEQKKKVLNRRPVGAQSSAVNIDKSAPLPVLRLKSLERKPDSQMASRKHEEEAVPTPMSKPDISSNFVVTNNDHS